MTHNEEMIVRAAELNQKGAFDQALAIAQRALEISTALELPDALGLLYQQMSAQIGLENFEGAIETFRQAESLMPSGDDILFSPMLLACGDLCDAAGEPDVAISMYQRVLKMVRDVPSAQLGSLEDLAILNLYMAQAMNGLGLSHFNAGRKDEALVWLEKAVDVFTECCGADDTETLAVRENLETIRSAG